jgi:hypothetical protein
MFDFSNRNITTRGIGSLLALIIVASVAVAGIATIQITKQAQYYKQANKVVDTEMQQRMKELHEVLDVGTTTTSSKPQIVDETVETDFVIQNDVSVATTVTTE